MPTVIRVRGLRVVIFTNDHWPPHVHVIGPGQEAKIALSGKARHPTVMATAGFSRAQLAVILVEIDRHHDLLMQRWREIHGDT